MRNNLNTCILPRLTLCNGLLKENKDLYCTSHSKNVISLIITLVKAIHKITLPIKVLQLRDTYTADIRLNTANVVRNSL